MPNWCLNVLTITGPSTELKKLKKSVQSKNNVLDFEKIISSKKSRLSCLRLWNAKNKQRYGNDYELFWFNKVGYDWCVENWGTKWNSHNALIRKEDDNKLVYIFSTAWNPPLGIFKELVRKYPSLKFKLKYIVEGYEDEDNPILYGVNGEVEM